MQRIVRRKPIRYHTDSELMNTGRTEDGKKKTNKHDKLNNGISKIARCLCQNEQSCTRELCICSGDLELEWRFICIFIRRDSECITLLSLTYYFTTWCLLYEFLITYLLICITCKFSSQLIKHATLSSFLFCWTSFLPCKGKEYE